MENQVPEDVDARGTLDMHSTHDSHDSLRALDAGLNMTGTTMADFNYQFTPYDGFDDHETSNALVDAAFNTASATPPASAPHSITDATVNIDGLMPTGSEHVKTEAQGPTPAEDTPAADTAMLRKTSSAAAQDSNENEHAISDDGSQDDANEPGPGTFLLDDPLSDNFGLATSDPVAAIEVRGTSGAPSNSGHRPSFLGKDDKADPDATPAWSELKTKAGKERKRLPLACIACRRKKIRCSGEKPACKHCIKSRTPCVYKATTRKATPRTDYMAMLDRRIKRMEDRIIKIVPKSDQDSAATTSVTRAVVKAAIPGTNSGSTGPSTSGSGAAAGAKAAAAKKRAAEDAFGPELDQWARVGPKNRPGTAVHPHSILLQQETEDNKLFQEGLESLPSEELQVHLSTVFFENIYGQAYHLLHRPSYMRKLRAGTLPPVLILSVCAVSARFSNDPSFGNIPNFLRGEEWASEARDIVTRRYEWPNLTILTCLLILGLHEFGTCHGGRSWALGGQAIRMAFALQLHKDLDRESPTGPPLSFIDREIRRRTMWACFLMDRFNSSGTDRPTFIKEETIKIQLPIKESLFQLDTAGSTENLSGEVQVLGIYTGSARATDSPNAADLEDASAGAINTDAPSPSPASKNMGVAAFMVRAIAVWGRIINYLNQGGKELDPHAMWHPESGYAILSKQVDELLSTLPPTLAFTADNWNAHRNEGTANQFLFLHIAIQQNILFMNRFAVSSPKEDTPQGSAVPMGFVTKAGAKAFAAANRISTLLKESDSMMLSAPFVGYCAFLSSTVHVFGIFSGNPTMSATAKQNLGINVRFLAKMKRYWGMFHFMSENLREQYRSCADAAQQGTPKSDSASASSPIFQYGDWFDRYPHGVASSDFGDHTAYKKKEKGDDAVLEQKPELKTVGEFFVAGDATGSPTANTGSIAGTNASRDGVPRPIANARRKSVIKKPHTAGSVNSSRVSEPMPTDPLVTDLAGSSTAVALHAQQQIQLQQQQQQQQQRTQPLQPQQPQLSQPHDQHRRHFSMSGESSGPHNFNGMSLPHSQVTASAVAAASFEASMTPISPVNIVPFNLHHHQQHPQQQHPQHPHHQPHPHHQHQQQHQHPHQQQPSQFFQQDMLSLSQQGAMLPELDRRLVFGAYGGSIDGASATGGVGGDHTSLDTAMSWDAPSQRAGLASAGPSANSSAAMDHRAGVAAAAEAMNAYAQGQSSSAWFMPFNMDPPEITQDLSSMNGLDQFANIFGNSSGVGPGQGGGGLGNLH